MRMIRFSVRTLENTFMLRFVSKAIAYEILEIQREGCVSSSVYNK